ncbi:TLD domain-containing protein [Schistosoma japonicum]|nr:TLD domain-containing protein [Schistosoma japonicum]
MEASEEFYVYEVKPGDSLSAIAAQLRFVTPTQIARANHFPLTSCGYPPVFPGQRLIIPIVACTYSNVSFV